MLTALFTRLRFQLRYYALPLSLILTAALVTTTWHERPRAATNGNAVWTVKRDVARGHELTPSDLHRTWLPPQSTPGDAATDAVGRTVRLPLRAGTTVTSSLLTPTNLPGHTVALDVRGARLPPVQRGDALVVVVSGLRDDDTAAPTTYQVIFVSSAGSTETGSVNTAAQRATSLVVKADESTAIALSSLPTTARIGFIADN